MPKPYFFSCFFKYVLYIYAILSVFKNNKIVRVVKIMPEIFAYFHYFL